MSLHGEPGSVSFPASDAPRASLLILAWRNARLLARCLRSLAGSTADSMAYEVVILLNGASAEVDDYVSRQVRGATVLRSEVNLGFAAGCNRARASARGEFLVLLNDDVEVEAGWLEALVETAAAHPAAAAVGSRVLFPDGTLQEAGCVVWDDGSTAPVGRGVAAEARAYEHLRQVDYCSACALLVRARCWDEAGGMDAEYFPAYYEDTDLCLAMQERGFTILYEPRAVVRHVESASTDAHLKLFLFHRSQRRFKEKWAHRLDRYERANPTSSASVERAILRARGVSTRVLVVDDRLPEPALGSGFARMRRALVELARAGCAVTLHPTDTAAGDRESVRRLGVDIFTGDLASHLDRPEVLYDVVVISRPHNFERYAESIRRCQPQAALLYDAEALFFRRFVRRAELTPDAAVRARIIAAARSLEETETAIARESDHIVCVSKAEARWFIARGSRSTGVIHPIDYDAELTTETFVNRSGLLFVAGWLAGVNSPNADGLLWFLREVFPAVQRHVPDVRLTVTGDGVPIEVVEAAGPSVEFAGRVDPLRGAYRRARVAVAPVRFGSGVKLKVIEALQHGVPVVTTRIGAEGIAADAQALPVADRADAFARLVASRLTDEATWTSHRARIVACLEAWYEGARADRWVRAVAHARRSLTPARAAARARASLAPAARASGGRLGGRASL